MANLRKNSLLSLIGLVPGAFVRIALKREGYLYPVR
jgi:hypothetical protein